MVIHSVTPSQFLYEQPDLQPMQMQNFAGGYLEGYKTQEGFKIARVISTDPKIYLNPKYSPNAFYGK